MLGDEFRKARSRCIDFNGRRVCLYDEIVVPEECTLLLTFEAANSEWRQGVRIGDMIRSTQLQLTVAGQTAPGMLLWYDTSPREVEIGVKAPATKVYVYNTWDVGNGQSRSQLMGAGMTINIEESGSEMKRLYHCNDGHPVATFDHLVFSLRVPR